MATISNSDGSCKVQVVLVYGKWVPYAQVIATTSERVLRLLSDGPRTRRYLGRIIGGDPRFIDRALLGLARSGLVSVEYGRHRKWASLVKEEGVQ